MLAWLWKVFVGDWCGHQWEQVERREEELWVPPYFNKEIEVRWTLRCIHCGEMRRQVT